MTDSSGEDPILTRSTGGSAVMGVANVNAVMAAVGTRFWPFDLRGVPVEIRRLLAQTTRDELEAERIKTHFLFSRQRLLARSPTWGGSVRRNPAPSCSFK